MCLQSLLSCSDKCNTVDLTPSTGRTLLQLWKAFEAATIEGGGSPPIGAVDTIVNGCGPLSLIIFVCRSR